MSLALSWKPFKPSGLTEVARSDLREVASELIGAAREADMSARTHVLERLRRRVAERLCGKRRGAKSQRLVAAAHVLFDLAKQGWFIRVEGHDIWIARPAHPLDPEQDRLRIRQQLHAERDEQLRQDSVRLFIQSMENARFHGDKKVSIYSLMRDGRDLARQLGDGRVAVQPYLQFVRGDDQCELTGFRLVDIWRYFRHTWSTPYKSVPGRTLMIIVRDRSAPFHPVIGIAALNSATVGLTVRDESIGWTYKQVVARITADPSPKYWKWATRITDDAIDEIYKCDLLEEEVLTPGTLKSPTPELIQRFVADARRHRREHYRFMQAEDYKDNEDIERASEEYWEGRARSLLFRSKREQELANLLQIRLSLTQHLGSRPSSGQLSAFFATREGRIALTKLIRKAKSDRVGTVIADLAICGAIAPYGQLRGGKLVAMLMASPEIVNEYRRRYGGVPSIIASSMAGRRIVRASELVYISTTSLYGRRPNQYDRISIPVERVNSRKDGALRYEYLGRTKGIGTFQFSTDAVEAMQMLITQTNRGQRVNSVFGEGVNPRLRKIRDGLDELGLSANELLDHGAPRLVYGVSLIQNLPDYLLGIDKAPRYVLPGRSAASVTDAIGRWWFMRWCIPGVKANGAIEEITRHTPVYPVHHGARVVLPPTLDEEPLLFEP